MHILPETKVLRQDRFDLEYQECAQRGVRYATAILRNRADADEAVQETFYRLHKAAICRDDPKFRGKFFRALRNRCIDLIRRQKVRKEVAIETDLVASGSSLANAVSSEPETAELKRTLELAMQALPEDWRHVLMLRVHGQLSYDEIASATGFTHAQVRTWIFRSRRQLEADLLGAGYLQPRR